VKTTLRKLKKYDPITVRWTDSYTLNQGEWTDVEDIENLEVEIETIGLYLQHTKTLLFVCQGRHVEDTGVHGVFVIPIGCISGLLPHQRDKC